MNGSEALLPAIEHARAAERARLSAELHDGTQHRVVAALLCIGMAQHALPTEVTAAVALLTRAADGLTAALAELRALTSGGPTGTPDLAAAVRALSAGSPLPVHVSIGDLHDLSPALAHEAHRVTAEALTNAMKHSGADAAVVSIDSDDAALRIRVREVTRTDRKRPAGAAPTRRRRTGPDPAALRPRPTVPDPAALRRRVTSSGGQLRVDTSWQGTEVTAVLPRRRPPTAAAHGADLDAATRQPVASP